jgi:hypothetical protein
LAKAGGGVRLVRTCPVVPREHVCPLCETTCDDATALKQRVRVLERALLAALFALSEARELRDFAEREIEHRFPPERAA